MFMHRYVGPWTLINSTESPTHCWKHWINTITALAFTHSYASRQRKTTDININKKNVRQMNTAWHDRAAASPCRLDRKSRLWDAELIYGWQKASCLGDQKENNSDQETIHESPTISMSLARSRRKLVQLNDTGWYEIPPTTTQGSHKPWW